jgi:hypothetical protein
MARSPITLWLDARDRHALATRLVPRPMRSRSRAECAALPLRPRLLLNVVALIFCSAFASAVRLPVML